MTSKQAGDFCLALILVLVVMAIWIYVCHPDWIVWILTYKG